MARVHERDQEYREAVGLVGRLTDFLRPFRATNLSGATVLSPAIPAAIPRGTTLASVRADIACRAAELAAVRAAPVEAADLRPLIERRVADLAQRGRPRVSGIGSPSSFQVSFAEGVRPQSVLAWLFPAEMTERIVAMLGGGSSMPAAAKAAETERLVSLPKQSSPEVPFESSPV